MQRLLISFSIMVFAALACGAPPPSSAPDGPPGSSPPLPTTDSSQLWLLTRGEAKSDQTWGVDVDTQGNIYTAGYYQSPATRPFFDMLIYKFAPDGAELWRTQWGGQFQEKAFIVTIEEPYVYVGGLTHPVIGLTEADMAVLKLDMYTGEIVWAFQWGQGFGYEEVDGLVVDGDSLYLSGWTTGETTGSDLAVLKLNRADGSLVWVKTWGTDKFDTADGQMAVDNDALYVSGRMNAANILGGGEAVIAKFSKETGEHLDHRTWGGPFFSDGLGLTTDGTYLYVVGLTLDRGNGGQIFLLKYDKSLNLIWEQLWGGPGGESARVAAVDAQGNILIAGNTESYGNGETDIVLLQFSPDGMLNWSQTWGGPLDDNTQGLAIENGFAFVVGSTQNGSLGMNDGLLIKADARTGELPPP